MARHAFGEADERRRFAIPAKASSSNRRRSRATHAQEGDEASHSSHGEHEQEREPDQAQQSAVVRRPQRARKRRFTPHKRIRPASHHLSESYEYYRESRDADDDDDDPHDADYQAGSSSATGTPRKRQRSSASDAYPDTFYVTAAQDDSSPRVLTPRSTRAPVRYNISDEDIDRDDRRAQRRAALMSSSPSALGTPNKHRATATATAANDDSEHDLRSEFSRYYEYELILKPPVIDPETNAPKNVLYLRKVLVTF
jgi:hypothetical protein